MKTYYLVRRPADGLYYHSSPEPSAKEWQLDPYTAHRWVSQEMALRATEEWFNYMREHLQVVEARVDPKNQFIEVRA